MGSHYYPANDQLFRDWMANFVDQMALYLPDFGLMPADLTPLTTANTAFGVNLTTHLTKKAEAISASAAKRTTRGDTEQLLRALVRRIEGHPALTDEMRGILRLPVRNQMQSVGVIGEAIPAILVESGAGANIVHFGTDPTNEQINGKPAGVKGCNIYRKKAGEVEYQMINFASASPYIDTITGPATDYTYVVRYRGAKPSEISRESAAVTVAARAELAA